MDENPYEIELDDFTDSNYGDAARKSAESSKDNAARTSSASQNSPRPDIGHVDATRRTCTRLLICVLGIGLLWISSLQAAAGFVELIFDGPTDENVKTQWLNMAADISVERDRNLECISAEVGVCNRTLDKVFASFLLEKLARENWYLISNATALQQRCEATKGKKFKLIQQFKNKLDNKQPAETIPFNVVDSCLAEDEGAVVASTDAVVTCCTQVPKGGGFEKEI